MDRISELVDFIEFVSNNYGNDLLEIQQNVGIEEVASKYLETTKTEDCKLLIWLNKECKNVQKMESPITNEQALKLLEEYTSESILEIFESMENNKALRKKYSSANLTFKSWMRLRRNTNPTFGVKPQHKPYNPNA